MWPGIRPATGWMANLHIDGRACGEQVVEFRDPVLRVRHRHAVTRHDHDQARHLERLRGAFGRLFLEGRASAVRGGGSWT